jgi:hypothetical protein
MCIRYFATFRKNRLTFAFSRTDVIVVFVTTPTHFSNYVYHTALFAMLRNILCGMIFCTSKIAAVAKLNSCVQHCRSEELVYSLIFEPHANSSSLHIKETTSWPTMNSTPSELFRLLFSIKIEVRKQREIRFKGTGSPDEYFL